MQLKYKLWIDNNGKAFGSGPYKILSKVRELGSINKAAKELDMSYSKAWSIINLIENRTGIKFIHRETGGSFGGGSQLTLEGEEFMLKFSQFSHEADKILSVLFAKHFNT